MYRRQTFRCPGCGRNSQRAGDCRACRRRIRNGGPAPAFGAQVGWKPPETPISSPKPRFLTPHNALGRPGIAGAGTNAPSHTTPRHTAPPPPIADDAAPTPPNSSPDGIPVGNRPTAGLTAVLDMDFDYATLPPGWTPDDDELDALLAMAEYDDDRAGYYGAQRLRRIMPRPNGGCNA